MYDLLLQRSLQTQNIYFKDSRNHLKADWMLGFLNHSHLGGDLLPHFWKNKISNLDNH
jgi:hypothetical protein